MQCSNCFEEIKDYYYKSKDKFLQENYFKSNDKFCCGECLLDYIEAKHHFIDEEESVQEEYYVILATVINAPEEDLGYLQMLRDFETDRLSFSFDLGKAMRFKTKEAAREYFESFCTKIEYVVLKVTITTEKLEN